MSKSQITEGVVVRIEHELAALVQEIAEMCVPARRGMTELRLRRSLIFGRMGDGAVRIDIYEKWGRLEREIQMEVRDHTFKPGYVYGAQKFWAPQEPRGGGAGEVLGVQQFLSEISAGLIREIRADLEPPDESA